MSATTLDAPTAPTAPPITDADIEAFSHALDESPSPRCEVFLEQTEHPATGRILLATCGHSWLACRPHWLETRDSVAAWLAYSDNSLTCALCAVLIVGASWSDL